MAADVSKNLDRAKRFLEKNRVEDAIEAYLAVLDESPGHQEATQALGDLYARMDQPERAAVYYGMFFDLLVDPKDETKALAIYNRFLKNSASQQAPERVARGCVEIAWTGARAGTAGTQRGAALCGSDAAHWRSERSGSPAGTFCQDGKRRGVYGDIQRRAEKSWKAGSGARCFGKTGSGEECRDGPT